MKMKRKSIIRFGLMIMAVAVMTVLCSFALADEGGTWGVLAWTLNDSGTLTITGEGEMNNISYEESAPWIVYADDIVDVVISDGITSIGDRSFSGCEKINDVTIPDSVTRIGESAFSGCLGLRNFTIPESVTSIGDSAFDGCDSSALTITVVPGSYAFDYAKGNWYGYQICWGTFVSTWGDLTWALNDSGTLEISGNGDMAPLSYSDAWLEYRRFISDVVIDEGVTSIAEGAFNDCYRMISIAIPDSITTIGDNVFTNSGISSISIPVGVTSIGCNNFNSIYEIYVDPENPAFAVVDNVLYDKSLSRLIFYPYNDSITSYVVPDTVTSIDPQAFGYNYTLTRITIPASVISIGENSFHDCKNLKSISADPDNPAYASVDGVLFDKSQSTLICYPRNKSDAVYTIPDSVKTIGYMSFSESKITGIVIPDSVIKIDSFAFYLCHDLESLTVPESVTSIGDEALRFDRGLIKVYSDSYALQYVNENNYRYLIVDGLITGTWDNLTWTLDENGELTISGSGRMADMEPFADNTWLQYYSWINSIVIEDGITSIGNNGFYYCMMTDITIPTSVTSIGDEAFRYCSRLTGITIPASVTSIGANAFNACYGLTELLIPDSVTAIGEDAFENCSNLSSITLSSNLTSIADGLFCDCSSLTSITIPNGVTSIGNCAFVYCKNLEEVIIPDSVISIGYRAFTDCTSLDDIVIPDGVSRIERETFSNCSSLTGIIIPTSVTSIEQQAFFGCSSLTSVTIPESVISIYDQVFSFCTNLVEINVDSGNTAYSSADGVLYDKSQTILIYYPEGRTNSTFTIPASVISIRDNVFTNCNRLAEINVDSENAYYSSLDGVLCNKAQDTIIIYPSGKSDPYYTIPNSISHIGANAFCNKYLMRITIYDNVESIHYSAFYGCEKLVIKVAPNSYALEYAMGSVIPYLIIDETNTWGNLTWILDDNGTLTISGSGRMNNMDYSDAWQPLSLHIKKVVIEEGITNIGEYAFSNCNNLTSITIPDSVTSIDCNAFNYCSSLTSITIPAGVTSIERLAFYDENGFTSINVNPDNTTFSSVDGVLFNKDQTTLIRYPEKRIDSTYVIPDTVTSIGEGAFAGSFYLADITIPDSVTSIGEMAFEGSKNLHSITIPASVTSIGLYAFINSDYLLMTVSPNSYALEYAIDNDIPYQIDGSGNNSWQENVNWVLDEEGTLTISGSGAIPEIAEGEAWLGQAQKIETVVIENGITSISSSAFSGCYQLNSITIPESVTHIDSGAFSDSFQLLLRVEPDSYLLEYAIENHVPYWIIGDQKNGTWGTLNWVLDDDGTLTISGNGSMDSIVIGDAWLNYRYQIKRVIITEGVTTIANGAFRDCYNLTSVELPDGLTQIGESAFSVCLHLSNIIIPDSVTGIGGMAFFNCSRLATVTLPQGITTIEEGTFNSSGLTSIVIPNGVTAIVGDAFAYCSKLKDVVLPDSMNSIDIASFIHCTSLTSVFIPASVTSIGNDAFLDCPALTLMVAPDSYALEYAIENDIPYQIGESVRGACGENLTWILSGGTLIVNGTGDMDDFDYMNPAPWGDYSHQIQSIIINPGVTGIGANAFGVYGGYENLTSVIIPSTVTSIRTWAFAWCENLQEINLPEGVTTLGDMLFYHSGLTRIHIPASVTTLEGQCLASCLSMTAITVAEDNNQYASVDGVLFTKDLGTLVIFPAGKSGDYTVPSSVHTIHENAFADARELATLTIPGTVKTIERFGLYQCVADEIILQEGVKTIGVSAFNACHPGNDELYIPASVEEIGNYAFYMSYLENVEVSPDNPYFSSMDGSLYNKDHSRLVYPRYGTTSFEIPDCVTSIAPGAFAYNGGLTSVSISDSVTQIPEEMFCACTSLTDVTIPVNVTSIDKCAFLGCESISSLIIPDGVISIGDSAFANCRNLTSLTVPTSVTSIGDYAFDGCNRLILAVFADSYALEYAVANHILYQIVDGSITGTWGDNLTWLLNKEGVLTISGNGIMPDSDYGESPWFANSGSVQHVVIEAGVTSIGRFAFCDCSNMTTITIPNTVTSIGNTPFWGCNSLSCITIPDSVTRLDNYAFASCQGLTSLEIPASVTEIGDYVVIYSRNLESISVDEANAYFTAVDGVLFSKDMTELIAIPAGKTGTYIVPDSVTGIRYNAFSCSKLSGITLPECITEITGYYFENCSNLESIMIPKNVTVVSGTVFSGCSALKNITVDIDNQNFCAVDGVLFNKDRTELIVCPPAKTGSYTIPAGVTSIGDDAFNECSNLTSLLIPESVTSISDWAFSYCPNLTLSIYPTRYLLDYVTSKGIPYQVYAEHMLAIPSGTKRIESEAFEGSGCEVVIIPNGCTTIGSKAFANCGNLIYIQIPSSVTSIAEDAFEGSDNVYIANYQ